MNADVKAKWIEALRSGNYEQGKGTLQEGGQFCCLGVLCDVADPGGWNPMKTYHHGYSGTPGQDFLDEVGLPQTEGQVFRTPSGEEFNRAIFALTCMNDKEYRNFDQIADWIEANL